MKTLRQLTGLIIAASLGAVPAAALDWTAKTIERTIPSTTKELRVDFDFTNRGTKTVYILDIATSCGCTTARAEVNEVPAGASSTVRAIFTVGNRTGRQEKLIQVLTSENEKAVDLHLNVIIENNSTPTPAAAEGQSR